MGNVFSFATRRPVTPDLDSMSVREIYDEWQRACGMRRNTEEGRVFEVAVTRAYHREYDAALDGLEDDATVTVKTAARYLYLSCEAIRNRCYAGDFVAQKEALGPRGFRYLVRVAEVRAARVAEAARIKRERDCEIQMAAHGRRA